jgi:hypothetical protein
MRRDGNYDDRSQGSPVVPRKGDSPIGPGLEMNTATLFAATGQGWESSG